MSAPMDHMQRELDIIKVQKADCHVALWASIRERDALQAQLAEAIRERDALLPPKLGGVYLPEVKDLGHASQADRDAAAWKAEALNVRAQCDTAVAALHTCEAAAGDVLHGCVMERDCMDFPDLARTMCRHIEKTARTAIARVGTLKESDHG